MSQSSQVSRAACLFPVQEHGCFSHLPWIWEAQVRVPEAAVVGRGALTLHAESRQSLDRSVFPESLVAGLVSEPTPEV